MVTPPLETGFVEVLAANSELIFCQDISLEPEARYSSVSNDTPGDALYYLGEPALYLGPWCRLLCIYHDNLGTWKGNFTALTRAIASLKTPNLKLYSLQQRNLCSTEHCAVPNGQQAFLTNLITVQVGYNFKNMLQTSQPPLPII